MTVATAKAALAEGKPEAALGWLLGAWRACRDERLAEAIERVSAMVKRAELKGSAKKRHETFVALAAEKDPADLGRLYAALGEGQTAHFVEALEVIEALPADPRFTTRALELLQKPKVTSSSSFPAWRRLFNQLVKNEDLRAVVALQALDFAAILGPQHEYSAQFFSERAQKTLTALSKVKPQTMSAADAEVVASLVSARKAATRDLSALEAAVYAAPGDDAPRMVFADALLEQGDERGEFISLQLKARQGRLSAAERWREYDLAQTHRDAWLGPLKLALDKWHELVEFRGGFVHTFALTDKPHAVKVISETPAFATVRSLRLRVFDEQPLPVELLRSPALKHVTGLGGVSAQAFQDLFTAKSPWPYEEVVTSEPDYRQVSADVKTLCDTRALPKLTRLKVSGYSVKPPQFAPLWKSEPGSRLTHFGARMGLYAIASWIPEIEAHGLDARLRSFDLGFDFGARDFGAVLSRGVDGRLSDLEVWKCPPDSAHGTPKISELAKRLDGIPADRLTAFRYLGRLSKGDRKVLDATLSRQRALKTVDLR